MPPESSEAADGDYYARIPEWLLVADVSHAAVRLYAFLDRRAGEDHTAFPSRTTLAAQMRCSRSTIDRLLYELATAAHPTAADPQRPDRPLMAVKIEKRRDEAGDWTSNLYTVAARMLLRGRTDAPTQAQGRSLGSPTDAAGGSRTDDAQNQSPVEPQPPEAEAAKPQPLDLARQLVSRSRGELPAILSALSHQHGESTISAALQHLVDTGTRYRYPSELKAGLSAAVALVARAKLEVAVEETKQRARELTELDPRDNLPFIDQVREQNPLVAKRRAS